MSYAVEFFVHDLGDEEIQSVRGTLGSRLLTTGPRVDEFESRFGDLLDCSFAIGLSSCTAALHLALEALGVGPGDEVLVPDITFAATALAVLHTGATPVLVDVCESNGLINLELIREAHNARTKAVIPVHLYGDMVDMVRLASIAKELDLVIVEDAAHCIEGMRDGIQPGQLSDAACFSFFATKNMTCGEGGALVTNDEALAGAVRKSRTHGMDKVAADRLRDGYSPWDIAIPGWKYNMSDIQASILIPQFDRIWHNLRRREKIAAVYDQLLGRHGQIRLPKRTAERHALHLYTVQLAPALRAEVSAQLRKDRIGFTVNYAPLHTLSAFKDFRRVPDNLPVASRFGSSTLSLPFYPGLPHTDAIQVARSILSVL